MADDVVVMYCGQVVEQVSSERLFSDEGVIHPYTEGLMRAIPRVSGKGKEPLIPIPGAVPHPLSVPDGCRFAPRCPYATARCLSREPALLEARAGRWVRCHYPTKEERQGEEHRKAIVNPPS
jgi:peptide/nickel transport system ATP-binding protein